SHVSEGDCRSIFAHYVARGLSGAASGWDPERDGVTVHGLARYVREHVARWATDHRRAVQTPILLGDRSVNFGLKLIAEPEPATRTEAQQEALDRLRSQ